MFVSLPIVWGFPCGVLQAAVSGSEPSDAIRAVNALLTQLDGLKRYPNVMVLTTSNITEAIDAAFVDRADIKVGGSACDAKPKGLPCGLHRET
jgi:ATP-dependent 26S proteasome regulatory subunit